MFAMEIFCAGKAWKIWRIEDRLNGKLIGWNFNGGVLVEKYPHLTGR